MSDTNIKEEKLHGVKLPCIVFYDQSNGAERIGIAQYYVGSMVMIRQSSYSRELVKPDNLSIVSDSYYQ